MKKFRKVAMAICVVICIMITCASCGTNNINGDFDYVMDYFQSKIVGEEQELIHCDVVNNEDGYTLTYSYLDAKSTTYVVVITFDEECVITRYDVYGEGTYANNIQN